MYNKDVKYINWSDLTEQEKEDMHNKNKKALENAEKELERRSKEQGYLSYGDICEVAGLWDKEDRYLHKIYYDEPYIMYRREST